MQPRAPGRALRVAIVGAGLAGLAAAYRLLTLQRDEGSKGAVLDVRVFDAASRPGGVVRTERRGGFVLDLGPDSIFTGKAAGLDLVRELELDTELLPAHVGRPVHVLWRGRLHPLPQGFRLVAPTRWLPLARSGLFSWRGKLRATLEVAVPRRRDLDDESIASFVERRFGREILERVGDPLLAGIHAGDPRRLSIHETFPQLPALERDHGSVIRGMLRGRKRRRLGGGNGHGGEATGTGARRPSDVPFVSFRDGMERLVERLVERIESSAPGTIRTGVRVTRLESRDDGWRIQPEAHPSWSADACVLAVPAAVAARLLEGVDSEAAAALAGVPAASTATVFLGFDPDGLRPDEGETRSGGSGRNDVAGPAVGSASAAGFEGTGFLVPHAESRDIFACTWVSQKYDHRAPEGHELLRVFLGGRRRPEILERDDDELVAIARREIDELLGISAEPILVRVQRWPDANPQYEVGHRRRVEVLDRALDRHIGLFVTGSCCRGVGIPDTVAAGRETADRVHESLFGRRADEGVR